MSIINSNFLDANWLQITKLYYAFPDGSGGLLLPPGGDAERDEMRQGHITAIQSCIVTLWHSAQCQAPGEMCAYDKCWVAKPLWQHIRGCSDSSCPEDRCASGIPQNRTLDPHDPQENGSPSVWGDCWSENTGRYFEACVGYSRCSSMLSPHHTS